MKSLLLIQILLPLTSVVAQIYLETEMYQLADASKITQRYDASNNATLKIVDTSIQYDLCVDSPMQLDFEFRYLKSTYNASIIAFIDKALAPKPKPSATQGHHNFSESVIESIYLINGSYTLTLQVGGEVEMDYIKLSSTSMELQDSIMCSEFKIIQSSTIVEIEELSQGSFTPRSNASGKKSVLLHRGEQVTFDICVDSAVNVTIEDVVYSNDGQTDTIRFDIDGILVGKRNTIGVKGNGYHWNMFRSTGPVGEIIYLNSGKHELAILVEEADQYGIELDYIVFNVTGYDPKLNPLQCGIDVEIEAEDFRNVSKRKRSSASNGHTIHLNEDENVEYEICLPVDTTVSLKKSVYSNDGSSDIVSVSLDNTQLGTIHTITEFNGGNNWDVFRTLSFNSSTISNKGKHIINLNTNLSDVYGVEIDKIQLHFNFITALGGWLTCSAKQKYLLEAEHFLLNSSHEIKDRSNASSTKTVYLKTGDKITQTICVTGKIKLSFSNIMISNDGGSDLVTVKVQSITVAKFYTTERFNGGDGWNDIMVHTIATDVFLNSGEYQIDIELLDSDKYGVEVDAIEFESESFDGSKLIFSSCPV